MAARPTHIFRPPIRIDNAGPYVGFLELWVPTIRADVALPIHNGTRREWTALFNPTNGTLMEVHHVVEIGV